MASIPDYSQSLIANIKEKTTNPLLGTFLITWIFFNWDGIAYFLLTGSPIEDSLIVIKEKYTSIDRNLIYPSIIALALSAFLPLISIGPIFINEFSNRIKTNIKRKNSEAELMPMSIASYYREVISNKDKQITELENSIIGIESKTKDEFKDELSKKIEAIKDKFSPETSQKDKLENDIFRLLARTNTWMDHKQIAIALPNGPTNEEIKNAIINLRNQHKITTGEKGHMITSTGLEIFELQNR